MENKENKLLIYPYDYDFSPVLRHINMMGDYKNIRVVSPKGWGISGNDAGIADFGSLMGIIISDNFEKALNNCDTVLFVQSGNKISEDDFREKILLAVNNKKNIINTREIEREFSKQLSKKCEANDVIYNELCKKNTYNGDKKHTVVNEKIYELKTPIVFVLGVSERTNKFEIQLSLREEFIKKGYRVSQVGTRNYCELIEFHSFPQFMYDNLYTETEKITLFNHYIMNIEMKENPDVIIIGLPGGTMPFNNELTNKFGIMAFEVSNAVFPDAVVFSALYADYKPKYFENVNKSVKYKFGYEINCFNMSNMQMDWANSQQQRKTVFSTLNWQFIDKKIQQYNNREMPVFNIFNDNGSKVMSEFVIDKLSGNGYNEYAKYEGED